MDSEQDIKKRWFEFANRAFVEWRGDSRGTISEFAGYIGLSQSLMSRQLTRNGAVPRDQKVINAWVSKYGLKVYEVLGLEVPNDSLLLMPEPLRSIALEIRDSLAAKHIVEDSPEAGKVVDEIMKKYGYILTSIKDDPLQ
ncbi:MAG TPA: hypothetical protein PK040_00465 [Anaerolineaceae bacterium]|nr:hypothetical protein [Anaerolineaceae bacterium]